MCDTVSSRQSHTTCRTQCKFSNLFKAYSSSSVSFISIFTMYTYLIFHVDKRVFLRFYTTRIAYESFSCRLKCITWWEKKKKKQIERETERQKGRKKYVKLFTAHKIKRFKVWKLVCWRSCSVFIQSSFVCCNIILKCQMSARRTQYVSKIRYATISTNKQICAHSKQSKR